MERDEGSSQDNAAFHGAEFDVVESSAPVSGVGSADNIIEFPKERTLQNENIVNLWDKKAEKNGLNFTLQTVDEYVTNIESKNKTEGTITKWKNRIFRKG